MVCNQTLIMLFLVSKWTYIVFICMCPFAAIAAVTVILTRLLARNDGFQRMSRQFAAEIRQVASQLVLNGCRLTRCFLAAGPLLC